MAAPLSVCPPASPAHPPCARGSASMLGRPLASAQGGSIATLCNVAGTVTFTDARAHARDSRSAARTRTSGQPPPTLAYLPPARAGLVRACKPFVSLPDCHLALAQGACFLPSLPPARLPARIRVMELSRQSAVRGALHHCGLATGEMPGTRLLFRALAAPP